MQHLFRLGAGVLMTGFLLSSLAFADAPTIPLPQVQQTVASDGSVSEKIALRKKPSKSQNKNEIKVQGKAPGTGETINIDINSQDLDYDSKAGIYTATGNVYIIIPEKGLEILSDKATYDPKFSNMVAMGKVYIIQNKKVMGSTESHFDLKQNKSFYIYPKTIQSNILMKAEKGYRTQQYSIFKNGRMVLNPTAVDEISQKYKRHGGFRIGSGAYYNYFSAELIRSGQFNYYDSYALASLGTPEAEDSMIADSTNEKEKDDLSQTKYKKQISPRDIADSDFDAVDAQYKLKVKTVTVHRMKKEGFDKIVLRDVHMDVDNKPLLAFPLMAFGYNEQSHFLTYIGPEVGYDQDFGGWYYSPGWSFQMLDGWAQLSPSFSYGGGTRLTNGESVSTQPGIGIIGHFRSPTNKTDLGINSALLDPIFYTKQELFGNKFTNLRIGVNSYVQDGFFGSDRPRAIGEISDLRKFHILPRWDLRTYIAAGMARDNFYPTRTTSFFVAPTAASPPTDGFIDLQGQIRNSEPLLKLGKVFSLGALTQGRLAGYTNGDLYGIGQAGPYLRALLGPLFSQTTYLYAVTSGRSPFVSDTYYNGKQNVQTVNALDLGHHVSIGALESLSLDRDNARNALIVAQRLFISIGSKNIRFAIAYDTVLHKTAFGITFTPQGGLAVMDYKTMDIFQPGYSPGPFHLAPTPSEFQ